ncbi:MAG TPA: glycosyltransferase [Planctomycetota bacterium]
MLHSLGIPTHNRADLFEEALGSALGQTCPDLEVLVSDNASADRTPAVLTAAGDRIRAHRFGTDQGAVANFAKLLEMAKGDTFSWLQDDDLLAVDFCARAGRALAEEPEAVLYVSYALSTPSARSMHHPHLFGPPLPLDWMQGTPATVDGSVFAPLSLLLSPGIPPAVAFRTETLRDCFAGFSDTACPLFAERVLLAAVASRGKVVVDPRIGAIFREHGGQVSGRGGGSQAKRDQWYRMVDLLQTMMADWPDTWRKEMQAVFQAAAPAHRQRWYRRAMRWDDHILCTHVRNALMAAMYECGEQPPGRESALRAGSARLLQKLTPPLLWKSGRRLGRKFGMGGGRAADDADGAHS